MKKAPKLCFALSGNRWVSIREVTKGLACNCYCPACKGRLIARKGQQQQHHFAHSRYAKCAGGLETALHLLGKNIIASACKVTAPAIKTFKGPQLRASCMLRFSQSEIEKGFHGLVLDVLLKNKYEQLAVELKVTHGSTPFKRHQLIKQGLNCIEIDVLSIYKNLWAFGKGGDLGAFKEAVLYKQTNRKWLFNAKQHKWEYAAHKRAVIRKISHSQQGDYHHYHVFQCPKNKRFIRNGFRDGQSYARVFQDCMHCPSCREIVYKKQWIAYKSKDIKPIEVLCLFQNPD